MHNEYEESRELIEVYKKWRVEDVIARKIWNSLSSALQEKINFEIDQIIKEWEKENLRTDYRDF